MRRRSVRDICSFGVAAKDCFIIDLKTFEVKEVAKMEVARANPGVVEYEGKVLVFGGEAGIWQDQKLSSCEEYDPVENTWRPLSDMSLPKGYLSPVHYKSRIMLSGGEVNQIEAYLPQENRFDSFYAGYMDQVLMAASFADEEYFYTLRKNKLYVHQFNSDFDQFPEVKMVEIPYNIWMTRTQPIRLGQKFYFAVRE